MIIVWSRSYGNIDCLLTSLDCTIVNAVLLDAFYDNHAGVSKAVRSEVALVRGKEIGFIG